MKADKSLPKLPNCARELVLAGDEVLAVFGSTSELQRLALKRLKAAISRVLEIMPQLHNETRGAY